MTTEEIKITGPQGEELSRWIEVSFYRSLFEEFPDRLKAFLKGLKFSTSKPEPVPPEPGDLTEKELCSLSMVTVGNEHAYWNKIFRLIAEVRRRREAELSDARKKWLNDITAPAP